MSSKLLSGRYMLLEKRGIGGMATVYKARDNKENRIVAVKILDNKMITDQQKINVFFREVEVMSRIKHENCVRIYDHGIDGDTYYIVMEYVNGVTLQKIIDDSGKLSPAKAVKYMVRILAALDEAHRNQIIHRDIKPQNILVDENGNVKIVDFGISRLVDAKKSISDGDMVLGSVHYVSPEQAQGETVDQRSDLYSIGVVLYEMLTGHPPFDDPQPMRVVYMHCNRLPEPMRSVNKNISLSLDEVVLKALNKNPDDRYGSAADMARDLKKALKHPNGGIVERESRYDIIKEYIRANVQNIVLILFSAITIIGILGYGCGKVIDIMFKVDVPYVIDELKDDALEKLKSSELGAYIEEVYTSESSAGRVILQDPQPGTRVNKNRDIKLTVSVGEEPVELPDCVNMDSSEALKLLAEYGFREASIEYAYDGNTGIDTVLAQSPKAGMVSPQSRVTLTINSAPITLPVLCGKTTQQALDILESLNLNAQIITAYSPDESGDMVLLQSPASGQQLLRGTTVTIVATLNPEEIYYCDYNIRVPLNMHIRVWLKTPMGMESVVYDADADADDIVRLHLTSQEPGTHVLTVYYGDTAQTELLEFE